MFQYWIDNAIIIKSMKRGKQVSKSQQKILNLILSFSQNHLYQRAVKWAENIYGSGMVGLKDLTPSSVQQKLTQRWTVNHKRSTSSKRQKSSKQFCFRQCRFVSWTCVCYAYQNGKTLEDLNGQELDQLRIVCSNQSADYLKFHLKIIANRHQSGRFAVWESEQIQLLTSIIKSQGDHGKWKYISYSLYTQSHQKYYRDPRCCRQFWKNHVNPQLIKNIWTPEQDIQLLELICGVGRKWAKVAKMLQTIRTDHMVKNRVLSLINLHRQQLQMHNPHPEEELLQLLKASDYSHNNSMPTSKQIKSNICPKQSSQQDTSVEELSVIGPCSKTNLQSPFFDQKKAQMASEEIQYFQWPEFNIDKILTGGSLLDQSLGMKQQFEQKEQKYKVISFEEELMDCEEDDYLSW